MIANKEHQRHRGVTRQDLLLAARGRKTGSTGSSKMMLVLTVLVAVVVLAGGAESYTVPRDNDILLADGFFKRMRDLFAERAYEDALGVGGGGGGGGSEMADEAPPQAPVDTSHLDSPPKPKVVEGWPKVQHSFGQVTAVTVDPQGNPVIFHRGSRTWTAESFNESNHYQHIGEGPIPEATIVTLAAADGAILAERGAGLFYLPHGLTIDRGGNLWLTDVALHQAFKFMPGRDYPSITLGHRFEPGASRSHLCKPTAVAVAGTGEIFVADGYCNSRLLKFNAAGRLIRTIPQPPEFLSLQVPHGLALLEHLDMVCVADRENMRVVCPRAGLQTSHGEGTQAATIQEPDLGRVFAVAAYGDLVYAVNGPTSPMIPVRGFTIDPRSETIIDHWGPQFENPHAITFCPNGSAMYVTEIGPNRVWKFSLAN